MQFHNQAKHNGLTLVEAIVSLSIVGILAALMLPSIQSVNEASRKSLCQNNLKQIALATQTFHNTDKSLPSLYNGTSLRYPLAEWDLFHTHSWRVPLLPHIEQSALRQSLDWESLATASVNQSVATTVVPAYVCPSGSSPSENMGWGLHHGSLKIPKKDWTEADVYRVVRSDYDAMAGIQIIPDDFPNDEIPHGIKYVRWGVWGWPTFDNGAISGGNLVRYRAGKFRDVSDGLSNTIMLVERGGRPVHLVDGVPAVTDENPNADPGSQVGWSASNSFTWAINQNQVGVNHDNDAGIYSMHTGGAFVALADGSVKFLSDSTDYKTLTQMFGRSDGER